jgi:hypothetical protein
VMIFKIDPRTPVGRLLIGPSIKWLRRVLLLYVRVIMPSKGIDGAIRWIKMIGDF